MENLAAVLDGPNNIRIENRPVPEIGVDDVLIRVECVGICGSDVKLYTGRKCGGEVFKEPIVAGHEGAGVVVKVGSNVKNLRPGDRVAIEPTQPCCRCEYCLKGRYNLCNDLKYCCFSGTGGCLIQYYKHVANFCFKIPSHMSLEEAAAVQPLAIALHVCNRAGVKLGDNVLILGSGPIGLLCALTARAMGANKICMTDIVQSRLTTVREMVADHTLLVRNDDDDKETINKIENKFGCQPNVTIDACAAPSAQRVAMKITKKGGTILIVGIGGPTVEVPLTECMLNEIDVRGCYRVLNTYPEAIQAVASGKINLKPFITHHFPLKEAKEAFELAKKCAAMKIIIHLQE